MRPWLALLVVPFLSLACGNAKGTQPPSAPSTLGAPEPSGASPPSASPAATANAGADAGDAPVAPASASAPEPAPEPDKCAPVALAYEKSLRPKLRQCWSDAAHKTKDRILGSIRLILEIDNSGKVAAQRLAEKSDLPEPIQKCMLKAFKAEPIDGKLCDMKTFTIAGISPRS